MVCSSVWSGVVVLGYICAVWGMMGRCGAWWC